MKWFVPFSVLVSALMLAGCTMQPSQPQSAKPLVLPSKDKAQDQSAKVVSEPIVEVALADQRHSSDLDSGFGGTGHTSSGFGGTGIVGTLERFGSIWVEGVQIGIGQKTQIYSNLPAMKGKSLGVEALRLGQQVWMETRTDDQATTTESVYIFYAMAGAITEIERVGTATLIHLNGQRVMIDSSTIMPAQLLLQNGAYVRISGVPIYEAGSSERQHVWHATLVEPSQQGESWLQSIPDMTLSSQANKLVMHPSWRVAYESGDFARLPTDLLEMPVIQLMSEPVLQEQVGQ